MRMPAALLLLIAGAAMAQVAPIAEVEQLYLDPAGRGSLLVGNGQTLEGGTFRVSAAIQYSYGQVKSGSNSLLRDRFALQLTGSVGLTHWLELSGELPVVVYQKSEGGAFAPNRAGLGTPFIHARVSILEAPSAISLCAGVGLGLPVGSAGALGNGGLAFVPRVTLGRSFERVQLGFEVGGLVRAIGSFSEVTGVGSGGLKLPVARADRVGSQLYLSAAVSTIGAGLRGEASLRAFASLVGTAPGLEVLAGARYPLGDFELFFLTGPGLGGTPTTPTFRVYAGGAFGNGGPPLPRCSEAVNYRLDECPQLDKDQDGVPNATDLAPLVKEDRDGFQDEDGAPDPDNDSDGVLDAADGCPNLAGPRNNRGCPPPTARPPPAAEEEPANPPTE